MIDQRGLGGLGEVQFVGELDAGFIPLNVTPLLPVRGLWSRIQTVIMHRGFHIDALTRLVGIDAFHPWMTVIRLCTDYRL